MLSLKWPAAKQPSSVISQGFDKTIFITSGYWASFRYWLLWYYTSGKYTNSVFSQILKSVIEYFNEWDHNTFPYGAFIHRLRQNPIVNAGSDLVSEICGAGKQAFLNGICGYLIWQWLKCECESAAEECPLTMAGREASGVTAKDSHSPDISHCLTTILQTFYKQEVLKYTDIVSKVDSNGSSIPLLENTVWTISIWTKHLVWKETVKVYYFLSSWLSDFIVQIAETATTTVPQ